MRIFDIDKGMIFETRLGIKYEISGNYIYLVNKNDKYQFETTNFAYFKYTHYQKELSKCKGEDIDIIRVWDKDGRLIFGEKDESNLYDEEVEQKYKERLSKKTKCFNALYSYNDKNLTCEHCLWSDCQYNKDYKHYREFDKRMEYYEEKAHKKRMEEAIENDIFAYLCTPLTL